LDMSDYRKRVNLDIASAAWGPDGLTDFFWPYSREEILPARDNLLSKLIPLVRDRVQQGDRSGLAIGLLFKWLIADLLKMFEASILASRFSRDSDIELLIPNHFTRLAALLAGRKPKCDFFAQLARGPGRDAWVTARLKGFVREVQWNGLSPKLVALQASFARVAVQPTELTLWHARHTGVFLHYAQLGRWFGPMEGGSLRAPFGDSGTSLADEIAMRFGESLEAAGETFRGIGVEHARQWVICATNFVDFHMARLSRRNDLPMELWCGCVGSSPWLILLANAVRQKGGRVIAHDHGMGDAHHDQLAHSFTNYTCCDVFFTYNRNSVEVKRRERREDLMIFPQFPKLASPDGECIQKVRVVEAGPIRRVMYVPTAFHGEGARFRPILADVQYFDWQVRLLEFLRGQGLDVIYKPHPEGRARVPAGFAESFGFRTVTTRFEQVTDPVDAYVIDFCSSSTTGTILCSEKPVIYFDPGFPALLPEARTLLERRCAIVPMTEDLDHRMCADWQLAEEIIGRPIHCFDTAFVDRYYANC
jgi:hypothetical protein